MSDAAVIGSHEPSYVAANWEKVIGEWQKAERLVPITGAGVGMNFGLPSWLQLTDLLCDSLAALGESTEPSIRGERDLMLKVFRATHQLRSYLRRNDEVRDVIRAKLYSGFRAEVAGVWWLECIYQLALSSSMHITFNFDNLLEVYSEAVHPDTQALPVVLDRVPRKKQGQIDSYHVHGMLSHDPNRDVGSGPLVFDLISYVEQYKHHMDQMSVTLLHAFTNYRCIFLGLSMVDPNLLRLIKTARDLRDDGSCWGMVFGEIATEVAAILDTWGLACVGIPLGTPADYSLIPQAILRSLPMTDDIDIHDKLQRLRRLASIASA